MIAASIVLYNSKLSDIFAVVECCVSAMSDNDILYLIDNSEIENVEVRQLSEQYINVIYVFNGANLGYGAAHNVAMKLARAGGKRFHAVINPDITFEKSVLKSLASLMISEPDLAHSMPKIVYPDGATQYLCKQLPTPLDLFLRRFSPFAVLNEIVKNRYELRGYDYDSRMNNVPALSGCFMFLRLDVLEKIGFFDDNIFMYMEDFDLTRRILLVAKNCYYPAVKVVHAYQKGSYKNTKLLKYHLKSALYYFTKWGCFFDRARSKINSDFHKDNRRLTRGLN